MSLYSKYILPRLIDLAMRNPEATRLRAEWIPQACGQVLEAGIGSGLNLPFYSTAVTHIYGVDPSRELQQIARQRQQIDPQRIEFLTQTAEEPLPLGSSSIDTVVTTWTLCSVPGPARALEQIRRVLKKEGHLIFIEHGYAPDRSVAKWQDALSPLWKRVGGGCHLNRKIVDILAAAGFRMVNLKTQYLAGPRVMTYTYQGVARIA